jgi:hypothetical protein
MSPGQAGSKQLACIPRSNKVAEAPVSSTNASSSSESSNGEPSTHSIDSMPDRDNSTTSTDPDAFTNATLSDISSNTTHTNNSATDSPVLSPDWSNADSVYCSNQTLDSGVPPMMTSAGNSSDAVGHVYAQKHSGALSLGHADPGLIGLVSLFVVMLKLLALR